MNRPLEDAEILSVVDASDTVIGEHRRDEVHRKGLRHRAVHVLIFNPQEQLFLQKRGLHKKENPGAWDSSVAGHVDAGETYDDCCVREVEEEEHAMTPDESRKLHYGSGMGMLGFLKPAHIGWTLGNLRDAAIDTLRGSAPRPEQARLHVSHTAGAAAD